MTTTELLSIPPSELQSLSDAELTARLAPLFPQARAAYIGPKTSTVQVGSRPTSKKDFQKTLDTLANVLAKYQK